MSKQYYIKQDFPLYKLCKKKYGFEKFYYVSYFFPQYYYTKTIKNKYEIRVGGSSVASNLIRFIKFNPARFIKPKKRLIKDLIKEGIVIVKND